MHSQMHSQTARFVLHCLKCTGKRTAKCTANMKKRHFQPFKTTGNPLFDLKTVQTGIKS